MSTDAITLAAVADIGAVLDLLAGFASRIDFTDGVAAATGSTGAVTLSAVPGLSILATIAEMRLDLAALVAAPATLAAEIVALVQAFAGTGIDYRSIADAAAATAWTSRAPAAGLYTATIFANRRILAHLVGIQALIEAVRAATSATYASQDEALALRTDLADRLDAAAPIVGRALRTTLDALRVTLVQDIDARAAKLAALEIATPPAVTQALVLAHRLYDDPTRAAEICARNAVAHPGFVPAIALKVLST